MRKSGFFGEFGGLEEVVCGTSFSSPDQGRPEKEKVCLGEGLGSNLRMVPHKYSTLGD